MTTTASNAYQEKPTEDRWALRHGSRRLDRNEVDKIARRRFRIELEAQQKKMAVAKTLSPAMVAAGILAGMAFVFSVMTWLGESAQDKIDKAIAPIPVRIAELDTRVTGRLDALDKRMDRMEGRVDKVEERLSHIDSRLDRVDARFDAVDARFESIDTKLNLLLKRR
ncbi:hypothetical protein [Cupriavidus necator]